MTLPKGWVETALGDVIEVQSGYAFKSGDYASSGLFLVRIGNVKDGCIVTDDEIYVSLDKKTAHFELRAGDIVTSLTGNIGRVARIPSTILPAALNQRVARLSVLDDHILSSSFLEYFLSSSHFKAPLIEMGRGVAQQNVSPNAIKDLTFPLPPLTEQRRIVKKLDALTARITRARAELERTEALADRLRVSSLQDCFEGGNGASVPLASVLGDVRYGTSKKCDYNAGSIPVLRIPNIQGGKVDTQDLKSADFDRKEIEKLSLRSGDVLVIRSNGSLDLVGKSAVVTQANVGMLYAGYLIRLRPQATKIRPAYLQAFLSSPATRSIIENCAKSTSGVNNVNAEQLKGLRIPLPPLHEQDRVIATVEKTFTRADRLEAEATRAKTLLDRLESAILAKAFKGELVPQDPDDEPAETLLARIRAQHASSESKPRRGRRKTS